MRMIAKRGIFLWILAILFVAGIIFLVVSFTMHGSEWAMKNYNPHLYRNGELMMLLHKASPDAAVADDILKVESRPDSDYLKNIVVIFLVKLIIVQFFQQYVSHFGIV